MQVAKEAEVDFKKAQEKYEESRRIKADYYDAYVSLGNLDFERGKLALGLAIPPPTCAHPVKNLVKISKISIGVVGSGVGVVLQVKGEGAVTVVLYLRDCNDGGMLCAGHP